eukprot:COSAG02_NODE_35_length_49339_cov_20.375102_36_plen_65_part_00
MWDFYLCNCEAEFTTGHFGLGQFILRCPSKDYRGEVDAAPHYPTISFQALHKVHHAVMPMILSR